MVNYIFSSILENGDFTPVTLAASTIVSLLCGLIIAYSYMRRNRCTQIVHIHNR